MSTDELKTGAVISVDVNLNNGSGHTASVTSVISAVKELSDHQELGTVITKLGSRSTFSNSKINVMMSNFIAIEETTSSDPVKTTITTKYMDKTSLYLQSKVVLVKGRDIGPNGGSFQGKIYEFEECPDPPFRGSGFGSANSSSAIIAIGDIYNEISEVDEKTQIKSSSVYRNGSIENRFSYNGIPTPKDLSLSKIKVGYTLGQLGLVSKVNVPSGGGSMLFDISGTLGSVLSSIAASLGLYMFIHPSGGIEYISGKQASNMKVNQWGGDGVLESSYTKSALSSGKVVTYWGNAGTADAEEGLGASGASGAGGSFQFDETQRIARFRVANILGKLSGLKLKENLLSAYYGSFLASALQENVFDGITYFLLSDAGKGFKVDFSEYYSEELDDGKALKFEDVYPAEAMRKSAQESYKGQFSLKTGSFIDLTKKGSFSAPIKKPSDSVLLKLLEAVYTILNNTIYISNKYSKWKVERMQIQSAEANVSGPYPSSTPIEEISGLEAVSTVLNLLGKKDTTLEDLQNIAGVKGQGDYSFVAIKPFGDKKSKKAKKSDDYKLFDEENTIIYQDTASVNYVGFSQKLKNKIQGLLTESKALFDDRISKKVKENTVKCYYTMARKPVNDTSGEEAGGAEGGQNTDDSSAEKDEKEQKKEALSKKFQDIKVFTRSSGASALTQLEFELKTGTIPEVEALAAAGFESGGGSESSSVTLLGVHVPSFTPVTSSVSIKVGPQGATTTISESSLKNLSPDDSIIIARAAKAKSKNVVSSKFTARQKNALGL